MKNISLELYDVFKFFVFLMIITYILLTDITEMTARVDALLVMALSVALVWKSRNNHLVLIMSFFIAYSNYSIVVGEYLIGGDLGTRMEVFKTLELYGLNIRILLIFTGILTLFYRGRSVKADHFTLKTRDNNYLFLFFLGLLVYLMLFEIKRGTREAYDVSVTTIYGYAPLLFLFLYYYHGKVAWKKYLIFTIGIVFVIQDFYYGGRMTSLQVIFLFAIIFYKEKVTLRNLLVFGVIGIVLFYAVQNYRSSYSLENVDLSKTFDYVFDSYLVFDTPVGAWYASATHIAGSLVAPWSMRLVSFFAFLISIVLGSTRSVGISTVSHLVILEFGFANVGGGVLTTHFYFWLGWFGVILIAGFIVAILNWTEEENIDELSMLIILSIVFRIPGWYLYSPVMLFRSGIFFTIVLYYFAIFIEQLTTKQEYLSDTHFFLKDN